MKKYFAFAAGIFGFLAALFWFLSAYGPLPPMLSYWDGAPAFDPLYASMKFSAHMNTFAAVLSGCSALSTVASLVARQTTIDSGPIRAIFPQMTGTKKEQRHESPGSPAPSMPWASRSPNAMVLIIMTVLSGVPATSAGHDSRWPLFVAPFVGLVYYAAMEKGFAAALRDVVYNTDDLDRIGDLVHPIWGSHWIYRIFAELVSVSFGTFVAGGIARNRAVVASMIGGFGISIFYSCRVAVAIFSQTIPDQTFTLTEPSYQYVIDAALIAAAPIIGYRLGDFAKETSTAKPAGFAGIPRLHFIWLWFPAYWYAVAMIAPIIHYLTSGLFGSPASGMIGGLVNFVPIFAFAAPLAIGMTLLSDDDSRMHPAIRQTLGILVLIVGWIIAAAIQFGFIVLVNWIRAYFASP